MSAMFVVVPTTRPAVMVVSDMRISSEYPGVESPPYPGAWAAGGSRGRRPLSFALSSGRPGVAPTGHGVVGGLGDTPTTLPCRSGNDGHELGRLLGQQLEDGATIVDAQVRERRRQGVHGAAGDGLEAVAG